MPFHAPNTTSLATSGVNPVATASGPVGACPSEPERSSRFGAKGASPSSKCSGKTSSRPARRYASTANIAACWWLPWLPCTAEGFIVTITSGRVARTTRITRLSTSRPPHTSWLSGAERV